MSIVDSFNRYGATDCFEGTDKTTTHAYGEVYDALFTPLKDTATHILEIGVAGGLGLQAYSEYFTHAQIYGVDIVDRCKPIVRTNARIHVDIGDAKSAALLRKVGAYTYDCIIEDASHIPEDQIQHFVDYCKFVKPGGYYVMEDVHEKHMARIRTALEPVAAAQGFTLTVHDLRSRKGRFDDILFVFQRIV